MVRRGQPTRLNQLWDVDTTGLADGNTYIWHAATKTFRPIDPTLAIAVNRDRVTAAGHPSTLTLGGTPLNNSLLVWQNGTLLWPTVDYTLAGAIVTFGTPPADGDIIETYYLGAGTGATFGGTSLSLTQQKYANNGTPATTQTVTLTNPVAVDETVVLCVNEYPAASLSVTGVSGCGASWTQATRSVNSPDNTAMSIWVGRGTTAGGTSITLTSSGNQTNEVVATVWSGADNTLSSWTATGSAGIVVSAITTGSLTPATVGDVVVGAVSTNVTPTVTWADTPTSWTALGGSTDFFPAYLPVASLSPTEHKGSTSISADYVGAAIVLKQL